MITSKELEEIGFTVSSEKTSMYDGQFTDFYKNIDNGHIIEGHDTTEVYVTKDMYLIIIEIDHHSSYEYTGKRLVFKGRCETLEFFQQILKSVLRS